MPRKRPNCSATGAGKRCAKIGVLQLALTRLVEVIGEAAYRVSDEKRQQSTNIPWPQIIGMRAWVEILRPEHMAIRQWQMTRKPTLKTL